MTALWILTLIGAAFGGFTVLVTLAASQSAPQEAAGFAMACALAVVPYVFTKAIEGMGSTTREEEADRIIAALNRKNDE